MKRPAIPKVETPEERAAFMAECDRIYRLREPPVPILLWCPECGERHVDAGEFAAKPHHTHACQNCGMAWRPALVNTVGVRFLPGFKDAGATGKGG